MRLIDADALAVDVAKWKQRQHSMNPDYSTGYRCALSVVEGMIASVPTIDSIPVEWLREKMRVPQMTEGNPFEFVLDGWLDEQEAR